MSTERRERRIAAILSADIAGYSRLMEIDEAGTHARVAALQDEIIGPLFSSHRGRVFKQMGDGFLVEFDSVVDAIDCAIALQTALQQTNKTIDDDRQIKLRIGINLGDVIVEEDDRYGEGVILAARLQSQAEPGGILISQPAFLQLSSSQKAMFEDRGQRSLKNITMSVQVYGWTENVRPLARKRRGPISILVGGAILACAAIIGFAVLQFVPTGSSSLPPLPTGPKIAIVPFETLSEDDESARLATSVSKSISAAMSKFTDLFLLPLNATRAYQETGFTPQQLKEDLGADYVLEGNLWRSESNLRITAQLINATDARVVWSQTYDGDLTAGNIFDVLDEVTAGVVATVGTRSGVVRLQEAGRIRAARTENLTAYECVALYDYHGINISRTDRGRVRECLEKAVELDPNYAQAWSHLAGILIETYKNEKFSKEEAQALLDRADAAAKRATELDNANAEAYYRRAVISQLRGQGYAAFKELADKALALNPNDADVIGDLGNFSYYSGDLERGKELVGRMMKINPRYPSWAHFVFFLDHFRNDEFPEALAEVVKITLPNHCFIQWSKAAAYGKVGDTANGRATLDHISKIEPPCPDDPRLPFRTRGLPEDLVASFMDGLEKAGMDVPPDEQQQ